jgi:hypothetical protein
LNHKTSSDSPNLNRILVNLHQTKGGKAFYDCLGAKLEVKKPILVNIISWF